MAVVAVPEAAGAVEAAGSGVASGTAAVRGSPKVIRAERTGASYETRTEAPRSRQKARRVQPQVSVQPGRRKGSRSPRGRSRGGRNYQPVILAEFLVAILVVAVVPVAKGGSAEAKAKGSPSPYSVGDVKQMVAIGGVYFVLALLSGGKKTGRWAAWFGALVLAALGLVQSQGGGIKALFSVFGPGTPGPAGVVTPGTAQQIQNAAENALNPAFYNSVPDATGIFPIINPSTTQTGPLPGVTQGPPPGVAAPANATAVTITPPPGGTGVITT